MKMPRSTSKEPEICIRLKQLWIILRKGAQVERFIDIGQCEDNAGVNGRKEQGCNSAADPYSGYSAFMPVFEKIEPQSSVDTASRTQAIADIAEGYYWIEYWTRGTLVNWRRKRRQSLLRMYENALFTRRLRSKNKWASNWQIFAEMRYWPIDISSTIWCGPPINRYFCTAEITCPKKALQPNAFFSQ